MPVRTTAVHGASVVGGFIMRAHRLTVSQRRSGSAQTAEGSVRGHRLADVISGLWRGAIAGLILGAGMPHARAGTLLTWDLTSTTGSTSGPVASALVIGVSGSLMTSGAGLATGNSTSPSNTWNRT